jgi:NAD(P)H-quinone oxidoreductase subunit 5
MQRSLRFVQDLLAYDFYIDRLYRVSVVLVVERLSKFNSWLDQYVVDGAVNLVGLATIFSGQGLKYIGSGQSQFYIVTILLGISLLTAIFSWPFLQALGFDPFAF